MVRGGFLGEEWDKKDQLNTGSGEEYTTSKKRKEGNLREGGQKALKKSKGIAAF